MPPASPVAPGDATVREVATYARGLARPYIVGRSERLHRRVVVALILLLIVLLLASSVAVSEAKARASLASITAGPASSGPCNASVGPPKFSGSVSIKGGPSPAPKVGGLIVELSYNDEVNFTPKQGPSQLSCVADSLSVTTSGSGAFAFTGIVRTPWCDPYGCWNYTAPFQPQFLLVNGPAAGYFVSTTVSGTSVSLVEVASLSSTVLQPSGSLTVSVSAPTTVTATPVDGIGMPSPAIVGFAWRVLGVGWQLASGSSSSSIVIVAGPGAGPASLIVWVNGTYEGAPVRAPPATLALLAVPTSIQEGSVRPTAVDLQHPVNFTLTGTGAGGYAYSATIAPGLGSAIARAKCVTTPALLGQVNVACHAVVQYTTPGTAQPVATLSNGFSSASWIYPNVVVSSGLLLEVSPPAVVGDVGTIVSVDVTAYPGTGTLPFGPACLFTGDNRTFCEQSGGPSWTFSVEYALSGVFAGRVSVVDASKVNASAYFSATIVKDLNVLPIVRTGSPPAVGKPTTFESSLLGGAPPFIFWWNISTEGLIAHGTILKAASLNATFTPHSEGIESVDLTILDALGSRVVVSLSVAVGPGPVVAITFLGIPAAPTVSAGSPFAISARATDAFGDVVYTFAMPTSILVTAIPNDSMFWVNSSILGPLGVRGEASVSVPAGAWQMGYLNFTVARLTAGTMRVGVSVPANISVLPEETVTLNVGADFRHLVLSDPQVAVAGIRSNATLWQITDEFGNPTFGTHVILQYVFGSFEEEVDSPVLAEANGSAGVWVNFTAPSTGGGTVYVLSPSGEELLRPILVPEALPAAGVATVGDNLGLVVVLIVLSGTVVGLAVALARRRSALANRTGEATEEELLRFAEGSELLLDRLKADGPLGLNDLSGGWKEFPSPTSGELSDWLGGLLTAGGARAVPGPGGRPMFVATENDPLPESPRIDVDAEALRVALSHRDREEGTAGENDAGPADDDHPLTE